MAIRDQIVRIHFSDDTSAMSGSNRKRHQHQLKEQLYCCILATECFNHYLMMRLSDVSQRSSSSNHQYYHHRNAPDNDEVGEEWLSGWILVLIPRIQEYLLHYQYPLQSQSDDATFTTTTTTTSTIVHTVHVLYTQFMEQCLQAMTLLLELTPQYTTPRLILYQQQQQQQQRSNTSGGMDLTVLMTSLLHFMERRPLPTPGAVSSVLQCATVKFIYTLVSNGDLDLLRQPSTTVTSSSPKLIPLLTNIVTSRGTEWTVPSLDTITEITTTLYSIGTIIVASISVSEDNNNNNNGDEDNHVCEATLTQCVQYVQHLLSPNMNHSTILDHLSSPTVTEQLRESHRIFCREQNDQMLDQQVVQEQARKQESSRTIAQRLSTKSKSTDEKATAIAVDMDTNEKINRKKQAKASASLGTTHQSWEELQTEWDTMLKPVQISVDLISYWISLLVTNCDGDRNDDEREISIPLSSSSLRMDVDDDDDNDEYDTRMQMDDDDAHGDSRNLQTLQRVLRTCKIFQTVLDLYDFVSKWYRNQLCSTQPAPLELIREPISDLLSKTTLILGQLYSCTNGGLIVDMDRESFLDQTTYTLWGGFTDLLIGNERSVLPTISVTENVSNIGKNTLPDKSFVHLQESSISAMVAILRHCADRKSPVKRFTTQHVLDSLMRLLERYAFKIDQHCRQPIMIRDFICMTGIVLSESSSSSSMVVSDSAMKCATITLLRTSLSFLPIVPKSPSAQTATGGAAIVSVSDDTASATLDRQAGLIVVMEILNVLMDIYSDDDELGSVKHDLFYSAKVEWPDGDTGISVMMYYEQMIPIMKRELVWYHQQARRRDDFHGDDALPPEEQWYDAWKEILENSIQFVQYKKEHR